jgi:hypothetical protein
MELRGTILLRNIVDDTVFVLQTERLEQVGPQRQRQCALKQPTPQQQHQQQLSTTVACVKRAICCLPNYLLALQAQNSPGRELAC